MAKPPKHVPGIASPDTYPPRRTPLPGTPEGQQLVDHHTLRFPGEVPASVHSMQGLTGEISRQPSVLVSEIPRTDLFQNKSERQATWQFKRPDWLTQDSRTDTPASADVDSATREVPMYLDPADAALLSPATDTPDGIRYDKNRKTYVDTIDGTVMVRRNADGKYQQAFAALTDSPAVYFERIANTRLWRRKTQETTLSPEGSPPHSRRPAIDSEEPTPSPGKRPQLEDIQALAESLLAANPHPLNLPFGLWRNWGRTIRPPLGQHIEIDGLHFRIVQQVLNDDSRLAYLQHPLFSPAMYDAFEYMLRDNPSLQPKWAVRGNGQWVVLDQHFPFEMPITQYIARTFRHLSDQSVSAIARTLFTKANSAEVISGHGLAAMNQTFRYWADRNALEPARPELAEPLLMLRNLAGEQDTTPAISSSWGEGLHRLDFDPTRFPHFWNQYAAAPTINSLQTLFSNVLEGDGYTMITAAHSPHKDTLVFHRKTLDVLFVLKLPPIIYGKLQRSQVPFFETFESMLQSPIGRHQQTLANLNDSNKILYFLGGVQTDSRGQTTLFIIREN